MCRPVRHVVQSSAAAYKTPAKYMTRSGESIPILDSLLNIFWGRIKHENVPICWVSIFSSCYSWPNHSFCFYLGFNKPHNPGVYCMLYVIEIDIFRLLRVFFYRKKNTLSYNQNIFYSIFVIGTVVPIPIYLSFFLFIICLHICLVEIIIILLMMVIIMLFELYNMKSKKKKKNERKYYDNTVTKRKIWLNHAIL